jgi:hypothetical protein
MATRSLSKSARPTSAGIDDVRGLAVIAREGFGDNAPRPNSPDTWPVIWRVVAPGAGSYDHDWVMCETDDEAEARRIYIERRRGGFPVRLERVSCGPLPKGFTSKLAKLRASKPQNPGTRLRPVLAGWEDRS